MRWEEGYVDVAAGHFAHFRDLHDLRNPQALDGLAVGLELDIDVRFVAAEVLQHVEHGSRERAAQKARGLAAAEFDEEARRARVECPFGRFLDRGCDARDDVNDRANSGP